MEHKEREYLYWIQRNCSNQNNWVVSNKFKEIISEDACTCVNEQGLAIALPRALDYVAMSYFHEDSMFCIVKCQSLDQNRWYSIDNTKTKDGVVSRIRGAEVLSNLVHSMSGSQRKRVGLVNMNKIKFSAEEKNALKGILPIDFIDVTVEARKEL